MADRAPPMWRPFGGRGEVGSSGVVGGGVDLALQAARLQVQTLLGRNAWVRVELRDKRRFVGRLIAIDRTSLVISHARELEGPHMSEETRVKMAGSTGVPGALYADIGIIIVPFAKMEQVKVDAEGDRKIAARREAAAAAAAREAGAVGERKAKDGRPPVPAGVPAIAFAGLASSAP